MRSQLSKPKHRDPKKTIPDHAGSTDWHHALKPNVRFLIFSRIALMFMVNSLPEG